VSRFAVESTPQSPPSLVARATRLVDAAVSGRRHRSIVVPGTGVAGELRALTIAESAQVADDTRAALKARGIAAAMPGVLEGFREWSAERILRTIAMAVRDPIDKARALAPLEDWSELDESQLLALWEMLQDWESEIDPVGASGELASDVLASITDAAKKKAAARLMSYGSRTLAQFAITLAAHPMTAATPS
jgi:hypothetical protein